MKEQINGSMIAEMDKINNFKEAERYLNAIPQYSAGYGVDRMRILLQILHHPEEQLAIIHVAGTNGKGSVCTYLAAAFRGAGLHTGVFTSPHLVDIRERICLDGEQISKEEFVQLLNQVIEALEAYRQEKETGRSQGIDCQAAYFDYFLAIALLWYSKKKPDYVIMETGLGGRLDATNAVKAPILCILTSIGMDHMAVLGDTILQIAAEKAGIIRAGAPVVAVRSQENEVNSLFMEKAEAAGSQLFLVSAQDAHIVKKGTAHIDFLLKNGYYKGDMFTIATGAPYQVENCVAALTAFAVLEEKRQLSAQMTRTQLEAVRKQIAAADWPGRMEEVETGVYLDGAHNPPGVAQFLQAAGNICRGQDCILLFSVVRDKNFEGMIRQICTFGLFSAFLIAGMTTARGMESADIADIFRKYTRQPVVLFDSITEAYQYGTQHRKAFFMCAGSLYLVGEVKKYLAGVPYRTEEG